LEQKGGIPIGRLSGIVNHHIPGYLKRNQMPSYATNCIEDWEAKVDKIIEETMSADMTLISGIPPWVQMYFDRLQARTGKNIKDIFPNFSLFVHGGVNFQPYSEKLYESIGRPVDSIETYPASEGFIAYQDSQEVEGLLLLLDSGIFFEFIPMDSYFTESPARLSIEEVELGQQYAVVINSNAGLWGYSLGDTIKFVSRDPYRLVVTGRIKHFISAFGEHVISEEVEKAMEEALTRHKEAVLVEFTVAPQVNPDHGLPLHQWLVEFEEPPNNLAAFEKDLNLQLQKFNSYYDDLIQGKILRNLEVVQLRKDAFRSFMKTKGKLGGQNKVPRLANDRSIADDLVKYRISNQQPT
ncbi:MAG: GH3 family domain-containing protein, partial [Cyclobacteriaceae bacterium]